MNDLINMDFEDNLVRIVKLEGEPWFVGKDVCGCLDIKKARNSIDLLDDDERGTYTVGTPSGAQKVTIVSEPGLYRLIFRSRKPEAERFKRWLAHDVLPSIRKTGAYTPNRERLVDRADLGSLTEVANKSRLVEIAAKISGPRAACELWEKLELPMVSSFTPRKVDIPTGIVASSENQLRIFIEEGCQLEAGYTITARAMFLAYKDWALTEGHPIISETAFGRAMLHLSQDYNFQKIKARVVTYRGLRVKEVGS
ncbi:BRO family, N-terminal domain [Pseudovibrio ascidiaceicola]|uniref:BRO family, N-terminal domain n=1 Tax=Pseudovibrio ascidiaceicola TaxID=285279 RepID=A0A1I4E221_9HYPH|nr:Bro-N domain-containing protein [Pseudovibrio ascidiaceicola]SFK98617.1 BRO family, N-terminal domain [Pseudovibrio ascidiaceicola]